MRTRGSPSSEVAVKVEGRGLEGDFSTEIEGKSSDELAISKTAISSTSAFVARPI